jgi:hypothetical protein
MRLHWETIDDAGLVMEFTRGLHDSRLDHSTGRSLPGARVRDWGRETPSSLRVYRDGPTRLGLEFSDIRYLIDWARKLETCRIALFFSRWPLDLFPLIPSVVSDYTPSLPLYLHRFIIERLCDAPRGSIHRVSDLL